jgi:tetratricopeptide (TPR) repeat protein
VFSLGSAYPVKHLPMELSHLTRALPLVVIAACTSIGTQSEFLAGRQALLRGEPDNALSYFERVARSDSAFVTDSVTPRRSVWTYVGRAQYNSGKYSEARSAFEKALSHLSEDYVARLYLGLTLLRPLPAQVSTRSFSLQEVTYALREGVAPKRVAALARERGVAFDLTKETENQLRNVGADSFLVAELRNIRAQSAKLNNPSENQRAQGGKELAAALTGLRDWLDYTIRNTTQGQFWDPSQAIRKQIQLCLTQIAARPADWDTVISNVEWLGSQLEEESDRARRDEAAERTRQQRR